jgi:thymidine kinase
MAVLDIIIGPMFAGKSCELIKRIRLLKVLQKKYIVVKPSIDVRYCDNMIVSHNFEKENCITLDKLEDIYKKCSLNNVQTVLIDEGQFFDDLKIVVLQLVENYNINVVISGLDGDSNRNKFGQILDLIPCADSCIKVNAYCMKCLDGTNAPFTFRKSDNEKQVLIGASDQYMPLCREHYMDLTVEVD